MGNKELRELQTLIAHEKSVLTSHDKLSQDTGKAATALTAWGNSEGQDLSDVLTKAGDMLGLLVSRLCVLLGMVPASEGGRMTSQLASELTLGSR